MEDIVVEPPLYFAEEQVFDICFHPTRNILVASLITGQMEILQYSEDDVIKLTSLNHHKTSCRQSIFSPDGNVLVSVSKDQSFGVIDQNGTLQLQNKNSHKDAINTAQFLNNEIVSTGDDSGSIKIWDLRQPYNPIYEVKDHIECVNGIQFAKNCTYMLSCSQDGTMSVYDLRKSNNSKNKLVKRSECQEEDLSTCSTSLGVILLFKWDNLGDCIDRIPGHPNSIESMIKLDENTLITGNEDGFARGVSIYPNDVTDILGQHEDEDHFPIQKVSISHCKNFLASCSHDSSIKFYDISGFVKRRSTAICQKTFNDDMNSDSEMQLEKKNKNQNLVDDEGDSDENSENEEHSVDFSDDSGDSYDEEHKEEKKSKKSKYNPNTKQVKTEQDRLKRMDFFKDM